MDKIEVDKIEDRIIAGIALEAELNGKSFNDQIRAILAPHAVMSREERLKLVDSIRAMTPKEVEQTDSAIMIYDCIYLAAAQRHGVKPVTADRNLHQAIPYNH